MHESNRSCGAFDIKKDGLNFHGSLLNAPARDSGQ
jgi:hypothetical protein